ncbi:MAG: hypothetical protein ACJAS1_002347 [Oleiphilaceae bacterium]|jgi:hypothetical protein
MTTNQSRQWGFKERSIPYQQFVKGGLRMEQLIEMSGVPGWKIKGQIQDEYGLVQEEILKLNAQLSEKNERIVQLDKEIADLDAINLVRFKVCQRVKLKEISSEDAISLLQITQTEFDRLMIKYESFTDDLNGYWASKVADKDKLLELTVLLGKLLSEARNDRSKVEVVTEAVDALNNLITKSA